MSTENAKLPSPVEAFNLLVVLSKHPSLKLNLEEHQNIHVSLESIKALVAAAAAPQKPELTVVPEAATKE